MDNNQRKPGPDDKPAFADPRVTRGFRPPLRGLTADLVLADGSHWVVSAGNEAAAAIVSHLADVMRLRVARPGASAPPAAFGASRADAVEPPRHGMARRLLVLVEARNPSGSPATSRAPSPAEEAGAVTCVLHPFSHSDELKIQLVKLSSFFVHDAQTRGASSCTALSPKRTAAA